MKAPENDPTPAHSRVIEWVRGIGYRATCSCGWRTDYASSEQAALDMADLHKIKTAKTSSLWDRTVPDTE